MEMRVESTLMTLIDAESKAREIIEKAEHEARELRERTRREAQRIIGEARIHEGQSPEDAPQDNKAKIEAIRKEILENAEKDIQHWEELFGRNHDEAVDFVLNRIISGK